MANLLTFATRQLLNQRPVTQQYNQQLLNEQVGQVPGLSVTPQRDGLPERPRSAAAATAFCRSHLLSGVAHEKVDLKGCRKFGFNFVPSAKGKRWQRS